MPGAEPISCPASSLSAGFFRVLTSHISTRFYVCHCCSAVSASPAVTIASCPAAAGTSVRISAEQRSTPAAAPPSAAAAVFPFFSRTFCFFPEPAGNLSDVV